MKQILVVILVGLMLAFTGVALAEVLGPELVINGQFNTNADGWVLAVPGKADYVDYEGAPPGQPGCLLINGSATLGDGYASSAVIPVEAGATYRLTWTNRKVGTATSLKTWLFYSFLDNSGSELAGYGSLQVPSTSWTTYTLDTTAVAGSTYLVLVPYGPASYDAEWDNISVKKVSADPSAGLTTAQVQALIDASIAADNLDDVSEPDFNDHVHDKGSGGRMTGVSVPQLDETD